MNPHDEFEQLLAGLLDGTMDAARNRRLTNLLQAHPEFQAEYLDHVQLHALLQWRAGKVVANVPATTERAAPLPEAPTVPRRAGRWSTRRGLIAAAVALALGLVVLWWPQAPETQAAEDLVERVVDWNLDLAQAPSTSERSRIYAEQAAQLQATLAKTSLPPQDRELANTFMETSSFLVRNNDPLAEADRFNDVADKLVEWMGEAATARDEERVALLASTYGRVHEVGIEANVKRAAAAVKTDGKHQQRLDHVIQRGGRHARKLAQMEKNGHDFSHKWNHRLPKKGPHRKK